MEIEDLGNVLHVLRTKLGVKDIQISLGRDNLVKIAVFIPVFTGKVIFIDVPLDKFSTEIGLVLQQLIAKIMSITKELTEAKALQK